MRDPPGCGVWPRCWASCLNAKPGILSGGQKQRAAIARAMVRHPRLILADEPTAPLDWYTGRNVIGELSTIAWAEEMTVVIVTHESRASALWLLPADQHLHPILEEDIHLLGIPVLDLAQAEGGVVDPHAFFPSLLDAVGLGL